MTQRSGPGRVRACTECRQQKLRCDAHLDYSKPCSRCSKLGLECSVTSNFKRRKKRTKAQLQQELDELREQARYSLISSGAETERSDSLLPSVPSAWPLAVSDVAVEKLGSISVDDLTFEIQRYNPSEYSMQQTLPRTLAGQEVDPKRINDCFSLFFQNHAPLLPIIDTGTTPNSAYATSPVLFWTIVAIGSRKYAEDPTLLGRLTPHVPHLALSSLTSYSNPLQLIQALVLLCNWPMPISTSYKDISHVLSGAAIHLAMQLGLHIFGVGQDFARVKLNPNKEIRALRAKLWLHCLMTCQR